MELDQDGKPWYASRAVWGGVICFACGLMSFFGHQVLSPDAQSNLVDILTEVGSLFGSGLAVYGRWMATRTIGPAAPPLPAPPPIEQVQIEVPPEPAVSNPNLIIEMPPKAQ